MTDNDYPGGALRRGEQGVTGFSLTIGPDGRARDCVVTRTSGSVDLDRATCAKVSARARFAPAMDSGGSGVAATYANTIRWQVPNKAARLFPGGMVGSGGAGRARPRAPFPPHRSLRPGGWQLPETWRSIRL